MKKIPAYIITGFLGSGKTTVLQNLLHYSKQSNLRPVIVLNEIGETNVEESLFKDETVMEMLNGCICCSIQGDFTKELSLFISSLDEQDVPDLLLIEGTGIANPIDIVDALTDPLLIDVIELYSVINVIDCSKYLEYQSIFSSSKEVRTILKSQIEASTFLILNKMDLVHPKEKQKVRKKIEELKLADVPILETSYGNVDTETLLEKQIKIHRSNSTKQCGCSHGGACVEHRDESHNHSFQAIKLEFTKPVDRVVFERWLKTLPKTIVRGKGIIQLTETPGIFQFQYSSQQLQINRVKGETTIQPCLILIGVDVDSFLIESSFHKLF